MRFRFPARRLDNGSIDADSRRHALLKVDTAQRRALVEDLDSRNGTIVDGRTTRAATAELKPGSLVFIGSFLIEVFFSIPGLGREVFTAVNRSDYPVIQAVTVYLAALTMVINLLTDLLYKLVDPRVEFR